MAYTALDLITDALAEIQVTSPIQNSDVQLALRKLNHLIDSWANNRLLTYAITRTVFDLVNGTAAYTVGTGGNISVPRPVTMNLQGCRVRFIDTSSDPGIELPLWPLTDDAYQAIPRKTLASTYPTSWYYNPTYTEASPYATLTFWPIPNVSYLDGVFYAPQAVQRVALVTELALPPGYARFYESHLAMACAPAFGAQVQAETRRAATESQALIEGTNSRLVDLGVDLALVPTRRPSNIYTDQA